MDSWVVRRRRQPTLRSASEICGRITYNTRHFYLGAGRNPIVMAPRRDKAVGVERNPRGEEFVSAIQYFSTDSKPQIHVTFIT